MMATRPAVLAWHVATALQAHARACRNDGDRLPPELEALRACLSQAWEGPEGTKLALRGPMSQHPPMLLTIAQAADQLALSERQVKRLIADGRLASVRIGTARRVRRADLAAFVAGLAPSADGEAA